MTRGTYELIRQSSAISPAALQARREAAIRAMGLRAWYSHHVGSSPTKMVDISGNGVADATVGAGSNSPLWIPYTVPAIYMTAGSNNGLVSTTNISTPTGDLDIRFGLAEWGSANVNNIVLKDDQSSLRDFYVAYTQATNIFTFVWWETGGTLRVTVSGSIGSLATPQEYRVTLDVDNGAGGHNVVFQRRDFGSTGAWTTITTANAGAFTTSVRNSAIPVGAWSGRTTGGLTNATGTGKLLSFSIRDGIDGPLVINFQAASCGQTGYTDSTGTTWSISRATTGRKPVIQSPAARSANGVWLFGTDDYIDVPAAAIPALDTFAARSTVVAVFRRWNNPGSTGHPIFTTKASFGNTILGFALRFNTVADTAIVPVVGDGAANTDVVGSVVLLPLGMRGVVTASVGDSAPFVTGQINTDAQGNDNDRSTTVSTNAGVAGRIGNYLASATYADMEFEGILFFDRGLTATEVATIVAFYGGGS